MRQVSGVETVASAVCLSFISVATFLVLPVFIGAAVADLGLNEREIGVLGASVGGGSALSSAIMMFLVRRVNWRRAAWFTLGILVFANGASALAQDRQTFMLLQCLAALGGGSAYSLALTVLSDGRHPDRYFGFSVAAQVLFQVLGMLLLPSLVAAGGLDALLFLFVALQALGMVLVRSIPASGSVTAQLRFGAALFKPFTLFALAGCFFFFFNVGAVWTYVERMAMLSGFDAQTTGNYLAVGVAFGIPGALLASWCGERFGRLMPIAFGAAGTVGALLLLGEHMSWLAFIAGAALYNFVWNFSLSFQYAAVNAIDESGQAVAAAPAFHGAGAAVGPGAAAMLVSADSVQSVNWIAGAAVILSLLLFALALGMRRQMHR